MSECVSFLFVQPIYLYLYMQITSCLLLLLNQSGAVSCQLVSSLPIASAICSKLCIPYLVIPCLTHKFSVEATSNKHRLQFFIFDPVFISVKENDVQSDEESDGDEVEKRIESLRNSNHHSQSERWKSSSRHQDFKRQNYKRDQNGGKRKPFQKVTSVKKPKFNKNTDRQGYERSHGTNDINSQRNKSCQNPATMDQFHSAKTKSSVNKTNFNSDSKVHPSWEAKQKQKPSIQAFQGKKIVFE